MVCGNERLDYKHLDELADRLADGLHSAGLQRGERVAVFLENSIEAVISIFAILKAGGVFLVINPEVKRNKLTYILMDCRAKILVTDEQRINRCRMGGKECRELRAVVLCGPKKEFQGDGVCYFEDLVNQHRARRAHRPSHQGKETDWCGLIYTSGSTGLPRGVMLDHANMTAAADSITGYLENTRDDIILDLLPLSFDYGLYNVLMPIKFGGTVILEKSFLYPYQLTGLVKKERVTGLPLVPSICALFLKFNFPKPFEFPWLRYISSTGQALPVPHITRLRQLFPHTNIYSMYGLTECKRVSYLDPAELTRRPGSVGKAMGGTTAFIVDEKGNRVTGAGETGELVVRGPHIMKGYLNQPLETAQVLKSMGGAKEKMLFTGDLFRMDEEGFLYFVARKDDMIKTAAQLVSPKEIENVLYELDGIAEAAVCGVRDDLLGERVKAWLVLTPGAALSKEDIMSHCKRHLEPHMVPKSLEICTQLPRTTAGKVDKKRLTGERGEKGL